MREHRNGVDNGFTLIELLIVIVILGILAAIVVVSVAGVRDKADSASCKTNEATISAAAEAYYLDNGSYPANVAALVPDYIKKAPTDGVTYAIDANGNVDGSCPN